MKILLIYNPVSGKSVNREARLGKTLMQLGEKYGAITVYQMKAKGDGARFMADKGIDRYELIIGCGGDGTLHEIVDGAMQLGFTGDIGYIPSGSTNDYASNLGINSNNAVDNLLEHKIKKLDLGNFNGEYFNYVAAFGFFTDIPYVTPQNIKNSLGYLAYVLEGIKEIADMKPIRLKCETDSAIIEDDILVGVITNTLSVAGKHLNEDMAKLDDGMLEYIFVRYPRNILDIQNTILALMNGRFENKYMYYGQSKSFHIESEKMQWTLDGEDGGFSEVADITTHQQKLNIIVGD